MQVKIIKIKPFMHVTYIPCHTQDALQHQMKSVSCPLTPVGMRGTPTLGGELQFWEGTPTLGGEVGSSV